MTDVNLYRPIASVSERCDHQTTAVAKVLVAILQHGVDHPRHHLVLLQIVNKKSKYSNPEQYVIYYPSIPHPLKVNEPGVSR